jgi:TetR/AcrR family transcriptional regulator
LAYLLTAHAREGAELAQASVVASDPPAVRLRAMIEALADYLGGHPGVCSGLLAATGGGRGMSEVLAVNDTWVAAPLRAVVAEGVGDGLFVAGDPADPAGVADTVNAMLGGLLFGVLGRASSGGDPTDPTFRRHLVDQIERGLAPPS